MSSQVIIFIYKAPLTAWIVSNQLYSYNKLSKLFRLYNSIG